MKRAFIYARTSTKKQQREDRQSIDSQIAQAKEFLKNYPEYELQPTIVDATSAYSGSHLDAGLGEFLKQAESGSYVDDMLLVVYTDRLTRLPLDDAFDLLKRIARAKVHLAITSLGALIRHDELLEFGLRMTLTSLFHIAHTDSKIKSDRIRKALELRTEKIRKGENILKTKSIPPWISIKNNKYVADAAMGETIKFIFEQKISGLGGYSIAKVLTGRGDKSFTSNGIWTRSYVDKLLRSPSVYGAFVPVRTENVKKEDGSNKIIKHLGEPVEGYYPAIISKETYEAAQWSKSITPKGRADLSVNPFRGLMRCYGCGAPMSLTHGSNSIKYLRCNNRREDYHNKCSEKAVRMDLVKERILLAISKITLTALQGAVKVDTLAIKERVRQLEKAKERNQKLMDMSDSDVIADEAMRKIISLTKDIESLNKELFRVNTATPDIAALSIDMDKDPQGFNQAMLQVFEFIKINKRYMSFQLRGLYGHLWEPVEIDWESHIGTEEDRLESMADFLEFMQVVSNHKS